MEFARSSIEKTAGQREDVKLISLNEHQVDDLAGARVVIDMFIADDPEAARFFEKGL